MRLISRCSSIISVLLLLVAFLSGCSSAKKGESTSQPLGSTASTASATASPTASPAPASPFEDDPAVIALRAWASQLARTVNTGKTTDAALDALMTAGVKADIEKLDGGAIGLYYPGPLPFVPIQVTKRAVTEHRVDICVVSDGFAQDPNTHKPSTQYGVTAIDARAELVNDRWLMSGYYDSNFSCDGVKVTTSLW